MTNLPTSSADQPGEASTTSAWERLWSSTATGSIDLRADDPVAQALREHWLAQRPWMLASARVMDLGSGPAVLPTFLIEQDARLATTTRWLCADIAPIAANPAWPACIELHAGVDLATFRPTHQRTAVDALVSNFGVEYAPLEAVTHAARTWLLPGGRLHAIVHAKDSLIDQVAQANLADLKVAMDELSIFDRAQRVLQAMADMPQDPTERMLHGVAARDAYNDAVNELKRRMEARGQAAGVWIDILRTITGLLQKARAGGVGQAMIGLMQAKQAFGDERVRLLAMQRAALDETTLAGWLSTLAPGFKSSPLAALSCPLGLVGWVVDAERA
jgi:hypothetical protein